MLYCKRDCFTSFAAFLFQDVRDNSFPVCSTIFHNFRIIGFRGGQYRGTVTRYFFITVVGNVGAFLKKYRFWYRCYFFSTFTAVFGTFVWNGIKAIQKELKLQRSTNFQTLPT